MEKKIQISNIREGKGDIRGNSETQKILGHTLKTHILPN